MGKIAFVFSGQGAQYAGMGKSFYENNGTVRELFDMAESYRKGTLEQCFAGDDETLKNTKNTQPCLYLADIAAAITLHENGIVPDAVAGFSLGELPALSFSKAFSYIDGFKIACKRGELMSAESEKTPSSLMAVLKLENHKVEELCKKYTKVFPVNYNSPGQLVVAGLKEELELFKKDVSEAGGKAMPLSVSGGFHSPFMEGASKKFGTYLKRVKIDMPVLTAYSNVTASPYGDDVKSLLVKQLTNPVRWDTIITDMVSNGYDTFIETGAGNVLQKLIKRIAPEVKAYSVDNMESAMALVKELKSA
jgi:[acyl-carrier-protein] S-malonyltransferase